MDKPIAEYADELVQKYAGAILAELPPGQREKYRTHITKMCELLHLETSNNVKHTQYKILEQHFKTQISETDLICNLVNFEPGFQCVIPDPRPRFISLFPTINGAFVAEAVFRYLESETNAVPTNAAQ